MNHKAVIGIAYGDEGKGAVVDRYCATGDYSAVVRFNGGCQAAHNVITNDGRHHTFAQFGSGTLQGVPTYLSEFMMVEPLSLANEAAGLKAIGVPDPYSLLTIHPKALVTTPYHWLVNRAREDARGWGRHGSCGRGIGATAEYALQEPYALRVEDLKSRELVYRKLLRMGPWLRENDVEMGHCTDAWTLAETYYWTVHKTIKISADLPKGNLVFEGAQGVLLDEHVGFHPYTTWSTVTPHNIFTMVPRESVEVIGVTRTYMTRHGAGPFVTEDSSLQVPESHNKDENYQGPWRVGHLDIPALKYAIDSCGGIDGLYVTHADAMIPQMETCIGYEFPDGGKFDLVPIPSESLDRRACRTRNLARTRPVYLYGPRTPRAIAEMLDVPLIGIGTGPFTKDGVWPMVIEC